MVQSTIICHLAFLKCFLFSNVKLTQDLMLMCKFWSSKSLTNGGNIKMKDAACILILLSFTYFVLFSPQYGPITS